GAALVLRPRVGPLVLPVAIVERGPMCAEPARLEEVSRALVRAGRRRGVARVAVMPYWAGEDAVRAQAALARAGFRDVQQAAGAHASTLRLAIGGKKDGDILSGSDRKKLRYELKSAERAGAIVRRGERSDVDTLERLERDLSLAQGRRPRPPA